MFPTQEEADRTVFVGNLEARVREEILYELFLQVPSAGPRDREPENWAHLDPEPAPPRPPRPQLELRQGTAGRGRSRGWGR